MEDARPLTDDRGRGVSTFRWAADSATLLYAQVTDGEGVERLYAVDAAGGAPRVLTPAGARAEILGVSAADPSAVIVALNERDRSWADVVRIDVATGQRSLVHRNSGYARFVLDRDNAVRLGVRYTNDGGFDVAAFEAAGPARTLFHIPFEDAIASHVLEFEAGGRSFLMLDSSLGATDTQERDRTALVRVDMDTGGRTVLGEGERADVVDVWIDAATGAPEAFATEYLRRDWRALNQDSQADLDFLDRQLAGDFTVTSRSADDTRWIVVEDGPTIPPRSYLFDRSGPTGRRLTSLFSQRPDLRQAPLQPMAPIEIEARDGLNLVSYLTLPAGVDADGDTRPDAGPLPLVLAPHDGPWRRDSYRFSPMHQWLANRGYAVLSVNFRGSSGLGNAYLAAGNGEWGGRMQDDLIDAADWAVNQGIARPDRVAIVGEGFGGFAAISALTFTDRFRCGASFGAPVSLTTMINAAPWVERDMFQRRIADTRTEAGRQTLRQRSPLYHAGRVRAPLLFASGLRDPRTPRSESDQFAQALRSRGTLTYLSFPQEGAILARPQDRLSYLAVLEHFLADCLGGRVEPVGAAFEGARMEVYDGAVNVPGLSAFSRRPLAPVVRETVQPLAPLEPSDDAPAAPMEEATP